jgi:hypothetical protein
MSALDGLQVRFQDFLLGHETTLRAEVQDGPRTGRDTLLAVYRDGYVLRLLEALGEEYPGLRAMLGPQAFDDAGRAYVAAHPSRHPSVRWFGRDMAAFLATTAPWSGTPALAEMAGFEWALGEAFDAADAEPARAEALMVLPAEAWADLRLYFVPSLRRLDLGWTAPQAWQRRDDAEPGTLMATAEQQGRVGWVLWRPALETRFRSMAADETAALDAARGGVPFPEICDVVAALVGAEAAPARAAGLLRVWVDQGLLAGFQA